MAKNIKNSNKEKSAIDSLITHSRAVCSYKLYFITQRNLELALSRIPDPLPSEKKLLESLKDVGNEIARRIIERNNVCKVYLSSLIDVKRYGFNQIYYLGRNDLRDGYVLLHHMEIEAPEKVLLLSDYQPYTRGSVVDYDKIKNILPGIKPALKPGDLTMYQLLSNKNKL